MATRGFNGPVVNTRTKRVIDTILGLHPGGWIFLDIGDAQTVSRVVHKAKNRATKYGADLWDREFQVRVIPFISSVIVARGK